MSSKGLIYIVIGAMLEAVWAYGLKHANSALLWTVTIVCIVLSFCLFTLALKHISTSIAYVV